MTSLPNSPLFSSITRVAPGLSGVPIFIIYRLQEKFYRIYKITHGSVQDQSLIFLN